MMLSATPPPARRGLRLWRRLLLLRLCSGSRADPPEAAAVKRGRGGGMRATETRRDKKQWELPIELEEAGCWSAGEERHLAKAS